MQLKVVIVDDETHISMELEYILKKYKELNVIAICSSGEEALEVISHSEPDIVFLDISMPILNGIQVGHFLKKMKNPPNIIYITAYEEHAVEAFKIGAKGYLLKPFSDQDIEETVESLLSTINENKVNEQGQAQFFSRISGELDGKFYLLDQEDIIMAYAQKRIVYIKVDDKDYKTNFSLSELENRLDPNLFYRCHRSYVINLYRIREVTPWFNNTFLLKMDDQISEAPVSRNFIKELKRIIGM